MGLIIDLFAGGGGTSLGIERALGRSPDIAVNHDPEAVTMHKANHPRTKHYCENVWAVDPRVWTVATVPFKGAHFATFPPELIRPCVLAGCPVNGTVLDPFFGSGTVGVVCREENRYYVGIEINPEYVRIARRRIAATEGKGKLRMDVDGGAIDE